MAGLTAFMYRFVALMCLMEGTIFIMLAVTPGRPEEPQLRMFIVGWLIVTAGAIWTEVLHRCLAPRR